MIRIVMPGLRTRFAVALVSTLACAYASWAGENHVIVQKGRAFSVAAIQIARGDSLTFDDQDEFLHQIYIDSPDLSFDSPEQEPGQKIEVAFPKSGTFEVRCHIHPKMRLEVTVK